MKNLTTLISLFLLVFLASCQPANQQNENNRTAFTDLEVVAFKAKMQEDNMVILDVRTPAETAKGIINGAIEIDYQSADFLEKIRALDKNKTYLIYCRSGGRSVSACNAMADEGFTDLYNLPGGYLGWPDK